MALTYSEMIPLGKNAAPFKLQGIDGKFYTLDQFRDQKVIVIMFICVHCPYVIAVQDRIAELAKQYSKKGVQFIGICSNDTVKYPEDAKPFMIEQAKKCGFTFPYLIDDTQEIAKAYGAVCTPDIFVFDSHQRLTYRGRIDDSWKDPSKIEKEDLKEALEALVYGEPVNPNQIPSMGCSIKWKPSEE